MKKLKFSRENLPQEIENYFYGSLNSKIVSWAHYYDPKDEQSVFVIIKDPTYFYLYCVRNGVFHLVNHRPTVQSVIQHAIKKHEDNVNNFVSKWL